MFNWISLIVLVVTIVVAVKMKLNPGILAIGVAFVLGTIGGIDNATVIAGFGTSLFVMLLGVMYLFGIAQVNGTIDLLARKILAVFGKNSKLIPFIIYLVSIFIAAIGPGCIPTLAIMSVFSVALAREMGISPLVLAPIAYLGTAVGGMSPLASTGIIAKTLSVEQGVPGGMELPYVLCIFAACTVCVFFLYFRYGGHKVQVANMPLAADLAKFNKKQTFTLIGILALVLVVVITKSNVGLTAFIIGTVLILLGAATEKEILGSIAWGTIVLVTGFGVLMNVINKMGGILLLSNLLSSVMNSFTAPAVMSFTASIMGMFASTSGVVMPTLISTTGGIATAVGGVPAQALIAAICAGAHIGGLSPIAGGGLLLSAYATVGKASEDEQRKMYVTLFKLAAICAVIGALVALTGVFVLLCR